MSCGIWNVRNLFITMNGFSSKEGALESQLNHALKRAVERGTFLKSETQAGETVYFLNSPRGQAGINAMQAGKLENLPANLDPQAGKDKPNIYRLYEENIGPLTPLIAEDLRAAELEYPEPWIEEAFHLAVQRNARSWRYIDTILRRWKEEGRDDTNQRGDRQDRQGYTEWENG
jgi:DNA replication protein